MNKGFINIVLALGVATAVLAGSLFYTNYRSEVVQNEVSKLGATIATTSLSDTINTFRLNVNSSTDAINTQLVALSSTVSTQGATLSLVPIANGGTGLSATPGAEAFLVGNGSLYQQRTFVASSGLTLTTSSNSWTLSTQGIDTSQSFTWTGPHTHNSTTTFNSSTVFTATTTFSAPAVFSSSVSAPLSSLLFSTTTSANNLSTTSTVTLLSVSIPANTLVGTNVVRTKMFFTYVGHSLNNATTTVSASYGGSVVASTTLIAPPQGTLNGGWGIINLDLIAKNSSVAQQGFMSVDFYGDTTGAGSSSTYQIHDRSTQSTAVSATSSQTLLVTAKNGNNNATEGLTMSSYIIEKIVNQ